MLAELATALRGLGKHAEAQRCCTAAVTARPDYQRGWLELGRAQAAQGQCLTQPSIIYRRMLRGMQEEIYAWNIAVQVPCVTKTCRMVAHTCMIVCVTALLVTAASQSLLLFCINPLVSACTALPLAKTLAS